MNSGFRANVPVFGGSDIDNSYDQHNGYTPGQIASKLVPEVLLFVQYKKGG